MFHGAGHSLSVSFRTFVCVCFHYFLGRVLTMTIYVHPLEIRPYHANNSNDSLCAGISDSRNILYRICRFLFLWGYDMTPFRSSTICSFVAFRLCVVTFFSYKISYSAESICLPDKIYSKIFLALFPFMSVIVPEILMLAPSSIFCNLLSSLLRSHTRLLRYRTSSRSSLWFLPGI